MSVKDSLKQKKALNNVCFGKSKLFASEAEYDLFRGVDVKGQVDENVTKSGEVANILRESGNVVMKEVNIVN